MMFSFLKKKNIEKNKNINQPSLIEQLNQFSASLEIDNISLINEDLYSKYKTKIEGLISEYYRHPEKRQNIIYAYVDLDGEYLAYKLTLDFKNKSIEVRRNIIVNFCKELIKKSLQGEKLEELLMELEKIKEVQKIRKEIKDDEELLEIIKNTAYLLNKNYYQVSRIKEKNISDEEILKYKTNIILDGSNLIKNNIEEVKVTNTKTA